MPGLRGCSRDENAGDAEAPGHVELKHINSGKHRWCLPGRPHVLARRDIDASGRSRAHKPESGDVVRRHRLFEPSDIELVAVDPGPVDRLSGSERTVGVDVELGVIANRLAGDLQAMRIAVRLAADLDLHSGNAGLDPAFELSADLVIVVGRKSALP